MAFYKNIWIQDSLLLIVALAVALYCVRKNQLGVHHLTITTASGFVHFDADVAASNRFYYTTREMRTNVPPYVVNVTETNEYWHVWRIFQ